MSRYAPWLRAAVSGLCGVTSVVSAEPARRDLALALVAVLVAGPCLQGAYRPSAPRAFVAVHALLAAGTGLSQLWFGATSTSGWLFAAVSIMSVTGYFEWPDRPGAAHLVTALAIVGYAAGRALAAGAADGVPAADVTRLTVQATLAWTAVRLLHRAAATSDALAARTAARRVAAAAAAAGRAADRAYLALLHDTASTTLLMVSTRATEDFGWLPGQARRDLERLCGQGADTAGHVDLAGLLRPLSTYEGLDVRVDVPDGLVLPAGPASALYDGVCEALRNVRRHAGDAAPVVSGARTAEGFVVQVRDRGCGFDPSAVPPHRRGLSRSIRERMAMAGGRAEVRSAPGAGTTVRWDWPA
jgi:signal transduction histidine kinase